MGKFLCVSIYGIPPTRQITAENLEVQGGSVLPGFWPLVSSQICILSNETRWVTYKTFSCQRSRLRKAASYPPTWQGLSCSLTAILSPHCHFSPFSIHRARLEGRGLRVLSGNPGPAPGCSCGSRRDFCPWLPNSSGSCWRLLGMRSSCLQLNTPLY